MLTNKKYTDYKALIGFEVCIYSRKLFQEVHGVLTAVVGDVLIIQGFSCWGVLISDIITFDVNSMLRFERFQPK